MSHVTIVIELWLNSSFYLVYSGGYTSFLALILIQFKYTYCYWFGWKDLPNELNVIGFPIILGLIQQPWASVLFLIATIR